jgi:hypothetical protein
MKTKLMITASVLAASLLAAGAASAQTARADDGSAATATNQNYADSFNTDNSTNTDSSTYSDSSTNTNVADSYNSDADVYDSNNSDSSTYADNSTTTTNLDLRVVLSDQDLNGSVSNIAFTSAGNEDRDSLSTGAASIGGSAQQAAAGILTTNVNTGVGSLNQGATMVSATANVSFGAN